MNVKLLALSGLCLLPALLPHAHAQAIDPAFTAPAVYSPGYIGSLIEQPDGKLVISGRFSRLNGSVASSLTRLTSTGVVDAAFQQNIGLTSGVYEIGLAANGKILASSSGNISLTAGGLTQVGLLRLNADGTGDATFNSGLGPGGQTVFIDDFLSLPNGQTIVVGSFDTYNGLTANNIVRLTATGAVDATFNAGTGAASTSFAEINTVVALPSGKFLIAGSFDSYNGNAVNGLARLNADGSFDASFSTPLSPDSYVINVLVQPDGKILLTGSVYIGASTTGQSLVRLTATGALDTSFTAPAFPNFDLYSYSGNTLQLQSDGKILLANRFGLASAGIGRLGRLNANGTVDATYQVGTGPTSMPLAITLLANGKLLVAGSFTNFNGLADRPLVEVTSTGALDLAFQPTVQLPGVVAALERQPDGKLLVGGNFSEINGQPMRRLARLNANGGLDASFVTNQALDNSVTDLALQPDGRILATGTNFLQRYLVTGALDNSLATSFTSGTVKLLLQADGRIVLGSSSSFLTSTGVVSTGLMRLLSDGTRDNSFAPNSTGAGRFSGVSALTLQPNGKILVAGRYAFGATTPSVRAVMRLEATGAVDASFAGAEFSGSLANVNTLAVQPDGKVLAGGSFTNYGTATRANVARLNADGTNDAAFVPPAMSGTVNKLVLQPNNRILVAGSITSPSLPTNLGRLLSTGTPDASFGATVVPNSNVNTLLVQPDGAIVVGGSFTTIGGQPNTALARITASNVLYIAAPQAVAARTEAWPVPAHTTLNVVPDASAHPQFLDLVDVLGRPVLHRTLNGGAAATLSVESLPVGNYLLRVTYAEGTVVRRVQVQ